MKRDISTQQIELFRKTLELSKRMKKLLKIEQKLSDEKRHSDTSAPSLLSFFKFPVLFVNLTTLHCVKSIHIRSFSGLFQSECGK